MKHLFLIIALLASSTVLSQTVFVLQDFMYENDIESTFTVMYIPDDSSKETIFLEETKSRYILSRTNWHFHYSESGDRMLKLRAYEPGLYQVTQWIDDKEVQLATLSVEGCN